MAKFSTMYNYINRYISENCTQSFKEDNFFKLKAFLFMNVGNERNADAEIYAWGEELFKTNEEFKALTIGCLGNMKRVYGNNENCNFDETYKALTHNKKANLDVDFANLDSKYKIKSKEADLVM